MACTLPGTQTGQKQAKGVSFLGTMVKTYALIFTRYTKIMVVVRTKRRGHVTNVVLNYLHEISGLVWKRCGIFNLYICIVLLCLIE